MKATRKTDDPLETATPPKDPDFNDDLPGLGSTQAIDPEQTEFRDALRVGSYASVGALQTEVDLERQEAEQATLNVLEAMRAMDAGEQVKWRISRSGHEVEELNGYLETWPNHLMTIERLRDKFGGGTYYCKGFRKGRYCAHETLQISGEAKRKPSGVDGVNTSVPVTQAPQFDMQGFLLAQERREEKRRDEERRERQEREERDEKRRQERMQLLLTLGPAAIGALGGLFQGRPDNTAALITALKPPDPLTMLTQLKALQGNGQDGVLNRVLPMLIDMAGSKATGGDTGWLDVIKEFAKSAGPAVGGLIEAQIKAAQAQQNPVPGMTATVLPQPPMPGSGAPLMPGSIVVPESLPKRERRMRGAQDPSTAELPAGPAHPGRPAPTAANPSLSGGNGEMNMLSLMQHLHWLKDMLNRMLHAAARGKSPEVYAALFLEEVPEEITGETIVGLLGDKEWFANICRIEPRWNDAGLYPWLELARKNILNTVYGSMGASPSTAAQGGTAPATTQVPPSQGAPPVQGAHPPKPKRPTGEIERPAKLPSLTGD